MRNRQCHCGGIIVFEKVKTFIVPEETNGVCIKCRSQFKLVGNRLVEKEKRQNGTNETKNK